MKIARLLAACMMLVIVAFPADAAVTVHVDPGGNDADNGSIEHPFRTVTAALRQAEAWDQDGEIILHAGQYDAADAQHTIKAKGSGHQLIIRAADGDRVIFQGALPVEAKSLPDDPAVWRVEGKFGLCPPDLWEQASPIRYRKLADQAAVRITPASCALLDENTLVFRTSDGRPPDAVQVMISASRVGFLIYRDRLVLRDLAFENYQGWRFASAIDIRARDVLIEQCTIRNSVKGISVGATAEDAVISNCTIEDVGTGVFVVGSNTTVTGCSIGKNARNRVPPVYAQDDTAIQFYSPARGGIVTSNATRGFHAGVLIKAKPAKYLLSHNTFLDGIWFGSPGTFEGARFDRNIFAPGPGGNELTEWRAPGLTFNHNLVIDTVTPAVQLELPGEGNMRGDPRLVNQGSLQHLLDVRILSDSPAVRLAADGRPAGAGIVVQPEASSETWRVDVLPKTPAVAVTPIIHEAMEDADGSATRQITSRATAPVEYVTPVPFLNLTVASIGVVPPSARLVVQLNGAEVGHLTNMDGSIRVELAPCQEAQRLEVTQVDNRGRTSQPAVVMARVVTQPPRILNEPKIAINYWGAWIAIESDRPCQAELEYRTPSGTWRTAERISQQSRMLDIELGGIHVQSTTSADTQHRFSIRFPSSSRTYECRIHLRDVLNLQWNSPPIALQPTHQPPRKWWVAPNGSDTADGSIEQPLQTLQSAANRALPGDTVMIRPGLYTRGATFIAGGVPEAPIAIQAEVDGHVILDVRRELDSILVLADAPHVIIRGLVLRWFKSTGILVTRSPHVLIERCRILNDYWCQWPEGVGIALNASPQSVLRDNVLARLEYGVMLWHSPFSRLEHNTAAGNLYAAAWIIYSSRGTDMIGNAFCYTGNHSLRITEQSLQAVRELRADYNNYAAALREQVEGTLFQTAPSDHEYLGPSKGIVEVSIGSEGTKNFKTMAQWHEFSGQDGQSIFANPGWSDPARGKWNLAPDSPQRHRGPRGADIGASP